MSKQDTEQLVCEIVETHSTVTLGQLCRSCGVHAEWVAMLVAEGVIEPEHGHERWEFAAVHLPRVHTAVHLHRDLGVNISGLALALDLMDEIQSLRARLDALDERLPYAD
ncbi:chaperone modulator CbpM [Salinisphaera aquimarina]|uniref:Chaperone modulator CbpM n=1 Tax=Salinisphaera aquimarina TaxID=2094031 RepID=A0ABV7ERM8_9GAMM